jgi:hypothetical protein
MRLPLAPKVRHAPVVGTRYVRPPIDTDRVHLTHSMWHRSAAVHNGQSVHLGTILGSGGRGERTSHVRPAPAIGGRQRVQLMSCSVAGYR